MQYLKKCGWSLSLAQTLGPELAYKLNLYSYHVVLRRVEFIRLAYVAPGQAVFKGFSFMISTSEEFKIK